MTLVGPNNSAFGRRNGSQPIAMSSMLSLGELLLCDALRSCTTHKDALTGFDKAEVAGSSPASRNQADGVGHDWVLVEGAHVDVALPVGGAAVPPFCAGC